MIPEVAVVAVYTVGEAATIGTVAGYTIVGVATGYTTDLG